MPAYNEQSSISKAIESVLNQTFSNFEFIIINDCSTDSTLDKILSYTDNRIVLINNADNRGVAESLNEGIRASQGDFIARMDADDFSNKSRFKVQLDFLENNPDVGMVGSWCTLIENNDHNNERRIILPIEYDDIINYFKKDNPFIHSSVLIRKEVFRTIGLYSIEKGMEDYDLFIRIAKKYRVCNIPKNLVVRYDNNNISTKRTYEGLTKYRIYKKRLKYQLKAINEFGFNIGCFWYLIRTVIKMLIFRLSTLCKKNI